jgi:hypothetical protein
MLAGSAIRELERCYSISIVSLQRTKVRYYRRWIGLMGHIGASEISLIARTQIRENSFADFRGVKLVLKLVLNLLQVLQQRHPRTLQCSSGPTNTAKKEGAAEESGLGPVT